MGVEPTDLEGQLFLTLIILQWGQESNLLQSPPMSVLPHTTILGLPPVSGSSVWITPQPTCCGYPVTGPHPVSKGGEFVVLVPFPGGFLVATNSTRYG